MYKIDKIIDNLERVRKANPLVLNITNYVVTNTTANALLALGASPVMSHATEEIAELARISGAVVINLGTVGREYLEPMPVAMEAANEAGVPVVIDPVGAGASRVRTEFPLRLLAEHRAAIVRGNGSEIMALAGQDGGSKGVDSTQSSNKALEAANLLADRYGCVVCISGATDIVTDGERVVMIGGGTEMATKVTGMGCTASALCGAFAAVADTPLDAVVAGMAVMKVAAELAEAKSDGPGTLQLYFYDSLYRLDGEKLAKRLLISQP